MEINFRLYEEGQKEEKKELAESNAFAVSIFRMAKRLAPEPWIGSASELLRALENQEYFTGDRRLEGWPKTQTLPEEP